MRNRKKSMLLLPVLLLALCCVVTFVQLSPSAEAAGTGYYQLVKSPVSGTVNTSDYKVDYSGGTVTYSSFHAYGNKKVVKYSLLNQLPNTLNPGDKVTLNISAAVVSIQQGLDQVNIHGTVTVQGNVKNGKIYATVQETGAAFPKTNSLTAEILSGPSSASDPNKYIKVRFDCTGYDASAADNWWVYEWVAGQAQGSSGTNKIILQLDNPWFTVNGVSQELDPGRGTTPVVYNGRTLLPIRAVVEAMGGSVGWDGNTGKITVTARGVTLEMWLGSYKLKVNGTEQTMSVAPEIINGRTMVPIRFLAENLGCQVDWLGDTSQIVITY